MTLRTGKPTRSADSSDKEGFTLIELILVMAMLVILISLISPALSGFFRGRTLDSEARRLITLIRYGQNRAISEGVPMVLWIDPQIRAYGLVEESSYDTQDSKAVAYSVARDVVLEADASSFKSAPVPATMTLNQSLRPGRNAYAIRFDPDGLIASSSPVQIRLREQTSAGSSVRNRAATLWLAPSGNRMTYDLYTNTTSLLRR